MNPKGTLIFFCGKMGSGKTTLSRKITSQMQAILLSEDEWLKNIYPDEIQNINDDLSASPYLLD